MPPTALVLHASREGQSERIAQRAAARLADHGLIVELADALTDRGPWSRADCVLLVASVHLGHHSRKLESRVAARRDDLVARPSAFLSVSLSAAGRQPDQQADARRMLDELLERTGWRPTLAEPCAGALRYSRYSWLKRLVMKHIASEAGGETDTTEDHEYTDWSQVERVADSLAGLTVAPTRNPSAAASA